MLPTVMATRRSTNTRPTEISVLLGQMRHRRGRVQSAAQHSLRRRRLGLCRRPREPPRPGVRRQRQVRNAWSNVVHRPSALHMTTGKCPLCFIGEVGPYLGSSRGFPNLGSAHQHPVQHRQAAGTPRVRRRTRMARRPGSSCRRTGSRWIRMATSTWARYRSRRGRRCSRTNRGPPTCAACRSW